MLKTCLHLIMKLPYRRITMKHQKRRTLVINEIGNKTDEIYGLQSLATEMKAIKLFINKQFY